MINHRPLNLLFFVLITLSSSATLADRPGKRGGENGDVATIIEEVIVDVVGSTVDPWFGRIPVLTLRDGGTVTTGTMPPCRTAPRAKRSAS